MTRVKICGITNLEDALMSIEFGADELGFNFYEKSPRYIGQDSARKIIDKLDGRATAVGVFVNKSVNDVIKIATESNISVIQLHGDESRTYVYDVRSKTHLKVMKVFRIAKEFSITEIEKYSADAILIDACSPDLYGGSGEMADWNIAKTIAANHSKVYLAGGLSVENVVDAIKFVRPYAVDVASGVESSPGKKDPKKLEAFIKNAKNA